jgi:hypothetical protein
LEKHTAKWHRCWSAVKRKGFPPRNAAAICTWSLKRTGSVFEADGIGAIAPVVVLDDEAPNPVVTLTVEEANSIDEVLGAEMEANGIEALIINTDSWEIEEVRARVTESRPLADIWDRSLTEAKLDKDGNLSGVIVVAGVSSNGNDYTDASLESGPTAFANKPIYINHPTRTEMRERPERDERDKIGKLPNEQDIFIEALGDGRNALKFRNGKLSKTADWLATKIREGISGAMSINASGSGHEHENGNFIVEAFTDATSLDFVTEAAAGGQAILESQQPTLTEAIAGLTLKDLAEARPDIVNDIASRERRKAYGEKREMHNLREVLKMSKNGTNNLTQRVAALEARNAELEREQRSLKASAVVDKALTAQSKIVQRRVRRLIESDRRAFVEQEPAVAPEPTIAPEPPGDLAPPAPDAEAGDPPVIELPPDAAALPEAAQALFLSTYTDHLAEGEEMATHKAWTAVSAAGWIKDETSGQWGQVEPEVIADIVVGELGSEAPAEETTAVTEESFAKTIARLVKEERAELAALTGAGQVHGMGAGAPLDEPVDAEQQRADLVESFMTSGMSKEEAELAAAGRPARRGV